MTSRPHNQTVATSRLTGAPLLPTEIERRRALQIETPFPATIRGITSRGDRFEHHVVLESFSACSLSTRLTPPVVPGATLFVVVRLSDEPTRATPAPLVALHGVVTCVESERDGAPRITLLFTRHRFLYTDRR